MSDIMSDEEMMDDERSHHSAELKEESNIPLHDDYDDDEYLPSYEDNSVCCVACAGKLHEGAQTCIEGTQHVNKRKWSYFIAKASWIEDWAVTTDTQNFIQCNYCDFDLGRRMVKPTKDGMMVELYSSQIMHKEPNNRYYTFIGGEFDREVCPQHHERKDPCYGPRGLRLDLCHKVHLCTTSYEMLGERVFIPERVDINVIGGSHQLPEHTIYKYESTLIYAKTQLALQTYQMIGEKESKSWNGPELEDVYFDIQDDPLSVRASFRLSRWSDPNIEKELTLEKNDQVRFTTKKGGLNVVGIVEYMPEDPEEQRVRTRLPLPRKSAPVMVEKMRSLPKGTKVFVEYEYNRSNFDRMRTKLKYLKNLEQQQVNDSIWYKVLAGPTYAVHVKRYRDEFTSSEIKEHWQQIVGNVVTIERVFDKDGDTGRVNVEFKTPDDVQRALEFNNAQFLVEGDIIFMIFYCFFPR